LRRGVPCARTDGKLPPRTSRSWTANKSVHEFVKKYAAVLKPARVHLCDGSEAENKYLINDLVTSGAGGVCAGGVTCCFGGGAPR
jgi:hypothetical protein